MKHEVRTVGYVCQPGIAQTKCCVRDSFNQSLHIPEKLEFCLAAAGKAKEHIPNKEERDLAERALARSREWMDGGDDVSEELYSYLDNEENGLTLFQERETDVAVIDAWNVIIDAVAYVCKSAYLEAGAEYLSEPVESVNEDTIGHMIATPCANPGRACPPGE